ncbi:SPOR domain-containing protein [Fulvimarina sp. MAC8]|uniref:SPOR domain-containing protein n=1 Tax=Fulvimarina sp. MAC8 TaxID=3162874 RepID=UPI0032EBFD94
MLKHWIFAAALGSAAFVATPSHAADSCGYFAFAGAFSSFNAANRRANQVGGSAWGLDSSDSPNAGRGMWVVAIGPGSRGDANRWRNQYRSRGIGDAYVAYRCFYGE